MSRLDVDRMDSARNPKDNRIVTPEQEAVFQKWLTCIAVYLILDGIFGAYRTGVMYHAAGKFDFTFLNLFAGIGLLFWNQFARLYTLFVSGIYFIMQVFVAPSLLYALVLRWKFEIPQGMSWHGYAVNQGMHPALLIVIFLCLAIQDAIFVFLMKAKVRYLFSDEYGKNKKLQPLPFVYGAIAAVIVVLSGYFFG